MKKSRRRTRPDPNAAPAIIDATAVYDKKQATAVLNLAKSTLSTEIKKGRLRVSRRAGRYMFLGEWLLAWVAAGEQEKRPSCPGTNGAPVPSPEPGSAHE